MERFTASADKSRLFKLSHMTTGGGNASVSALPLLQFFQFLDMCPFKI